MSYRSGVLSCGFIVFWLSSIVVSLFCDCLILACLCFGLSCHVVSCRVLFMPCQSFFFGCLCLALAWLFVSVSYLAYDLACASPASIIDIIIYTTRGSIIRTKSMSAPHSKDLIAMIHEGSTHNYLTLTLILTLTLTLALSQTRTRTLFLAFSLPLFHFSLRSVRFYGSSLSPTYSQGFKPQVWYQTDHSRSTTAETRMGLV